MPIMKIGTEKRDDWFIPSYHWWWKTRNAQYSIVPLFYSVQIIKVIQYYIVTRESGDTHFLLLTNAISCPGSCFDATTEEQDQNQNQNCPDVVHTVGAMENEIEQEKQVAATVIPTDEETIFLTKEYEQIAQRLEPISSNLVVLSDLKTTADSNTKN